MNILKKLTLTFSGCLLLVPFVTAQPAPGSLPGQGAREVTFSGIGSSDKDFDNGSISLAGSYGIYYTDNVLFSVQQSLSALGSGNDWSGGTIAAVDYHLMNGVWRPFVGVNAGLRYGGHDVGDNFSAGAQGGVKYYVQNDAFIFARADYGYTFESADDVEDEWNQGRFGYGFGVGMNF